MRTIPATEITEKVKQMCIEANIYQDERVREKMRAMLLLEKSNLGKDILNQILKSAEISAQDQMAICQDTGASVFLVEIGEGVCVDGARSDGMSLLTAAISEGVRRGYDEGYLRKSIVKDPLRRTNTGDNTPAMINFEVEAGDKLKIAFLAKGAGCENMSALKMMTPAQGVEGIKSFVVDTVVKAHANPCPPIVVGVGIGGNFEKVAWLAKKALFREVGIRHRDPFYAKLEEDLLEAINKTGVGPQGLGGTTTALDVAVEVMPCHIASMPVAVNIDCHAHRSRSVVI